MTFKSLPQLLDYFKDEKTCIEYYEKIRWNGKPVCPFCGTENPYKTNRGYKCSDSSCHKKFTVKVGTIFESSKISFRIWFAAIYLATAHKKGISSVQLAIDLDITQKTAWFVLHRVREMLRTSNPTLLGESKIVESDEAYIGGNDANRHADKKLHKDHFQQKQIVLGLIEREGKVLLKHLPRVTTKNMVSFIQKHVPVGATIYTDEHNVYKNLKTNYTHDSVNHSLRVYVVGNVHTNTIENFWSILKRGLYGVYHAVSEKHLHRYLDEFSNRFNERKATEQQRFEKFLVQSNSRRLSYNTLINTPAFDGQVKMA